MSSRVSIVAALLIALSGCVSAPDPRPAVVIQAERLMAQGVSAYNADSYRSAAAQFSEAQALFRSIDDRNGLALSHINLAETALAVGQLSQAQEHLDAVKAVADALSDKDKRQRLELLQARLYFRQGAYDAAQQAIQPMLAGIEAPDVKLSIYELMALAERTRIAFAVEGDEPATWTRLFAEHLKNYPDNPLLKARLLRFEAELFSRQGDHKHAAAALDTAMALYKERVYRPGIAATLHEQAGIAAQQGDWLLADELLQRSLAVRVWILDRPGTQKVLETLIEVNRKLERPERVTELEQWLEKAGEADFSEWERLRRR